MSDDTLKARLLSDASKRPAILSDCERVIEDEVKSKGGLSGVAIKGGYKVVKKVKPGIIREVMDGLLDDFVDRVEPFWVQHRDAGDGDPSKFGEHLRRHASEVADALLGITDDRAKRAKQRTLKGAYEKLRPQAKKHVQEAIPRVAGMLQRHL
jgi:hypothetical protein